MPYHTDMAFLGSAISDNLAETPEGFLICHNVAICRTGIQEYLGQEMGLPAYANRRMKAYRLPEDVFDEKALRSFEGKPITDDHPSGGRVTPENYSLVSKGHLQNIRVEGDYVIADLMIKDAGLIQTVKSGRKREVSAGYSCNYVPHKDGYKQINITANHLSVVTRGRAGPKVTIKDSKSVSGKKGAMKTMNKKQKMAKIMHACAQVMDADELVEVVELMNDSTPAPVAEKPKKDNSALTALLKVLAKDEDSDDDEGKEKSKTEDANTLDARIGKLEKALDALVQGITAAQDADDDEDEDEKGKSKTEDADDDDEDEEKKKKEAADAALKMVFDTMKPFLAKLPEKARKQAKSALREQFGKKSTVDAYALIAKSTGEAAAKAAAQVTDSAKVDYRALGEKIAEKFNPNYASTRPITADSLK